MLGNESYLSMPLPEDILKRKWAGDLTGAVKAIDLRLECELPSALRDRLIWEREIILRLPTQYPFNQAQALEKMREAIPDFGLDELETLDLEGKVDTIYLNGEKRYFVRFHKTLLKTPALMARTGEKISAHSEWLDPLIEKIVHSGSLTAHIKLRSELQVADSAFIPNETYRAHMPIPAEAAQISNVDMTFPAFVPKMISPKDAPQCTAFFEDRLEKNAPCIADYSFSEKIVYADLTKPAPAAPLYPSAAPVCDQDLLEEGSCIRFTPYLRALTAEIIQNAVTPLEKARKIYDFVTTRVTYAFVRDYFQIDHLGEYAAVNLRGDCGIQALLFINLCRIAGVPARWQSGLVISSDYVGSHDWAQFYLDGWGWLFADCSFGGSAHRAGNEQRRQFYFGNLEPLRVVFNRQYQAPLTPPKKYIRIDPYDNQTGEIECNQKGLNGRETDCDITLLSLKYE